MRRDCINIVAMASTHCLVGCLELVDTVDGVAHVRNVVVIPEYRRQGIARRMLEYAEQEAEAMGARMLTADVELANTGAVSLYTEFGFGQPDDDTTRARVGRIVALSKNLKYD